MVGSRKPNPTHITRFERESYGHPSGKPDRWSHYEHGVKVPAEHLEEIQRNGFIRIEETNADYWGSLIDEEDQRSSSYAWSDDHRRHAERMAGSAGLHSVMTYTVGHIVWPGKEDEVCQECPYGSAEPTAPFGEGPPVQVSQAFLDRAANHPTSLGRVEKVEEEG